MESAEAVPEGSSKSLTGDDLPEKEKQNADDDQAPKKAAVRKRTKTGCLST
jgi:hypothetical protein